MTEGNDENPEVFPPSTQGQPNDESVPEPVAPDPIVVSLAPSQRRAQLPSEVHRAAVHSWEEIRRARRRHFRTSLILFFATLLSTFLVQSGYAPIEYLATEWSQEAKDQIERGILREALRTDTPPLSLNQFFLKQCVNGIQYAIPLMIILLCHEMGHYLVAVRYRVPASLPYFIPLPLPPLGTMGAVILQGRGAADRVQMFDIAVCGPLAGLVVTLPVLAYGILTSTVQPIIPGPGFMELGEPLILQWMIAWLHGPVPEGFDFAMNGYAMAGWVGIFVTALNLLPVGQLDGGHILYTLVGRRAHLIAWAVIVGGCVAMYLSGTVSYILILILLLLTGVRHPPTADDSRPLGAFRTCVGWATLSFLIIGFTPQPIMVSRPKPAAPQQQQPAAQPNVAEADYRLAEHPQDASTLPSGQFESSESLRWTAERTTASSHTAQAGSSEFRIRP